MSTTSRSSPQRWGGTGAWEQSRTWGGGDVTLQRPPLVSGAHVSHQDKPCLDRARLRLSLQVIILPAPSPVPTARSSPRSSPWHHPPCGSRTGWEMQTGWAGVSWKRRVSPSSPCSQPGSPPTPRCCPQPCVTSAERSTAISVTRRTDAGHKAEDVGHGSGAGSWLLLLPPVGLGLCSQRCSRYRVQHMLKPQVAEL